METPSHDSSARPRRWKIWTTVSVLAICLLCVGWASGQFQLRQPATHGVKVVAEYPHDRKSFTQGLIVYKDHLLEGTGQYGESRMLRVDLKTGEAKQQVSLPRQYFGEGIAIANGELFQLTWKSRVGFVYDPETLQLLRTVRYPGEGWGLTFDGEHLVMSDGSATLRFLDPKTFQVTRRVTVRDRQKPIRHLNELEFVNNEIWANIWYEDRIVRIDPRTGQVQGWIDLSGLKPLSIRWNREAVHNGIAWDPGSQRLFVTGKNWPSLFEIEITSDR